MRMAIRPSSCIIIVAKEAEKKAIRLNKQNKQGGQAGGEQRT